MFLTIGRAGVQVTQVAVSPSGSRTPGITPSVAGSEGFPGLLWERQGSVAKRSNCALSGVEIVQNLKTESLVVHTD